MQEPDMPDRVQIFFEIHKASIKLFLVIMIMIYENGMASEWSY